MDGRRTYYFSVEGETECRYLMWLQEAINGSPDATVPVRFRARVAKDPLGRAKGLNTNGDVRITHVCDVESADPAHVRHFQWTLSRMHAAEAAYPHVTYELAYTNFTFELWILLHRLDMRNPVRDREAYLPMINRAFGEKFQGHGQYKREKGFSRILRQLRLEDVVLATERAEAIERQNELTREPASFAGYTYYPDNPALSVGTMIHEILEESGIL